MPKRILPLFGDPEETAKNQKGFFGTIVIYQTK